VASIFFWSTPVVGSCATFYKVLCLTLAGRGSFGSGLGFVRVVSDIRPCTDPTRLYPVQEASQTRSDGTKVVRISSSVRYRPSLGGEGSGTDRVLTRVPESYPDHQPPRKSASKPPLRANQPDDWLSWLLWLSGGAHRWSTISVT
jgi:hypothetical protein